MHSSKPRRDDVTRWDKNRRHWNETLDAQNLARAGDAIPLERQVELYRTEDVRRAIEFLRPVAGKCILDLGGGLGLMAILIARQGADVVIADLSPARLAAARNLAREAGVEDKVHMVCCTAEAMPFLSASFAGQTTKSVLIHTDLARAAAELARTLSPPGRAVFIEPLTRNPFVNAYRRIAAPKIWQQITDYFSPASIQIVRDTFEQDGAESSVSRMYFLAFLASPFNYNLKMPRLYRMTEKCLLAMDGMAFRLIPSLRHRSWFCLIKIHPRER